MRRCSGRARGWHRSVRCSHAPSPQCAYAPPPSNPPPRPQPSQAVSCHRERRCPWRHPQCQPRTFPARCTASDTSCRCARAPPPHTWNCRWACRARWPLRTPPPSPLRCISRPCRIHRVQKICSRSPQAAPPRSGGPRAPPVTPRCTTRPETLPHSARPRCGARRGACRCCR